VLVAANANQAHIDESVSALMERAAQKVLATAYLGQVVQRNLDSAFPNDVQSREYYAENVAAFYLPERMHLWQIFIPVPEGASEQVEKNAQKLASQLANDLRKGSKTFADVVIKHSKHVQSRINDGYMGLIKVSDIVPSIRAVVDKLPVGEISVPIRSDSGFHIIRKGVTVAGTQLEYETVKPRIEAQMRQEAQTRVRQAAVKKILETYPVELDMSDVNTWYQEFKTEQWPNTIISSRGGA
jgi:parvulin-like peptidyl-prolyl isomerase